MEDKEELKRVLSAAREKLSAIESKEREEKNTKLLGRYFKYSNCYSSERRWWLYGKVVSLDGDKIKIHRFQTTDGDKIEIEPSHTDFFQLSGEWKEIKADEFYEAWDALKARIIGMKP